MTYFDPEDILRQALRTAADSVEPSGDGLAQIRARLTTPRPLVITWVMAAWSELGSLLMYRAGPAIAGLSGRLRFALGIVTRGVRPGLERVRPAFGWLRPGLERLRPAADRLGAWAERLGRPVTRPGESAARPSRYAWLRPVIAMAAVVLVAVAGGFALSGLPHQISRVAASLLPSQTNAPGGGGHGSKLNGSGQTLGPGSTGDHRHRPNPSPSASCPPSGHRHSRATPKPSATPTPTPSPTPTATPGPTPSSSPTPTPTPTPTSSGGDDGGPTPDVGQSGTATNTTAKFVLGGANPSVTPSPSPTPSCTPTPSDS
jgi:hypothetical protein